MIINFNEEFKTPVLTGIKRHTIRSVKAEFTPGAQLELAVNNEVFAEGTIDFIMPVVLLQYNERAYFDVDYADMQRYFAHYGQDTQLWQGEGFSSEEAFIKFFEKYDAGPRYLIGWALKK